MPATYGFQPTYDPMPKMAYQAPIAYQPKPQSRPVSQPQFQPKPSPAPKADTSVASGDREPPAGYRYRVHVPPPDEIGIVLPE